jgi:hypothetical protein
LHTNSIKPTAAIVVAFIQNPHVPHIKYKYRQNAVNKTIGAAKYKGNVNENRILFQIYQQLLLVCPPQIYLQ